MGESAGTFFEELARNRYPPEVREEINWQAIARSHKVVIKAGASQGTYGLDKDHRPALGADGMVRMGMDGGMGAGVTPNMVELVPRPNLQQIVRQLQPELQALIAQMS